MKRFKQYISLFFALLVPVVTFTSCEKSLEEVTYNQYSTSTFFQNADDVKSAVTAMYYGMRVWEGSNESIVAQSSMQTDELICSWGWEGWKRFNDINFSEDFTQLLNQYNRLMPVISEITIDIEKIQGVTMDVTLKARYIAELKALRAHYSWILLSHYGPVPIRIDAAEASNPSAAALERPTNAWMVAQIEKDYNEAASVLPKASDLAAADYGRFTKNACLMGLMKLYMHQKRWTDVIATGSTLKALGNQLQSSYPDIFKITNDGNSQEVILAVPTRADASIVNIWLAASLPGNYVDPSGQTIAQWAGYKMPWATYDKFDKTDKRLTALFAQWPTNGGVLFDGRANNYIGAIPMKYGHDPNANGAAEGTDIVVWRYADALLMMAEAINESQGPVQEAYDYINMIRTRAGVPTYKYGEFNKAQFLAKIKDERLFELWCEGSRRDDMIRWGDYIQRAVNNGSIYAKSEFVLYPIPRKVISETNGVVIQNPGYN
jgi:hypothetical protein